MSGTAIQATITINQSDLEALVRRMAREVAREELARRLQSLDRTSVEYLVHEGPDDAPGDQKLLAETIEMLERYRTNREGWKSLGEFEGELKEQIDYDGL